MSNDTGLGKWDWIGAAAGLVGIAAGIFGAVAGFKAGSERAEKLNQKIDPAVRNLPSPQK